MEPKKDILWRSYLIYLLMVVLGCFIFAKAFMIQQVEGSYWRKMSDKIHLKYDVIVAERGTIYSEDGRMLSSSIPYFELYLDLGTEGVQAKKGREFLKHVDSVAMTLSSVMKDRSAAAYKVELMGAFRRKDNYHMLCRKIDFNQYKALRSNSYMGKSPNKNGFVFDDSEKRIAPFGLLASRTIGLSREYVGENGKVISSNVGLEKTYDSLLRGVVGRRLMRRISGGAFVPMDGYDIEPENGKDLLTTIDVNIQDIAENALMDVLVGNEATHGTCIVMEVATGKVKAIANLARGKDGSYAESFNFAITRSEPGSTFKLVTMLAALEDGFINLNTPVYLENGRWKFGKRTVEDSEKHDENNVTYQRAFELSSNVAMAKLAVNHYGSQPDRFISHLRRLKLFQHTGIGLLGESMASIPKPGDKGWSSVALPWMSFGYNIEISPLQTLMIYNAIANGGKMMKPYLVNAILKDGQKIQSFQPEVMLDSVCSRRTLSQLRACLNGVVVSGTAKKLFDPHFSFAGKTGTAKIANGNKGYTTNEYQSSFAGYFPADRPKYSCIVVVKNKPDATKIYGAEVAGPVFQKIASRLYTMDADLYASYRHKPVAITSDKSHWVGIKNDFKVISGTLNASVVDSSPLPVKETIMPDLKGFGLKDALELLEQKRLMVIAYGKGKVSGQSIAPGIAVQAGQTVYLNLGNSID